MSHDTMAQSDAKRDAAVEKHIAGLHSSLKITAAQGAHGDEVANTMRENAKERDRVIDKGMSNAGAATAIDDLKTYGEIAQAHANGIKKLATSFTGLYSAAAYADGRINVDINPFGWGRHRPWSTNRPTITLRRPSFITATNITTGAAGTDSPSSTAWSVVGRLCRRTRFGYLEMCTTP